MDMAAKHITVWIVRRLVKQNWVVAHNNMPATIGNLFIVLYVLEHIFQRGSHLFQIMVPTDQYLIPV